MSLSKVFEDNQTYSNRFGESEIFRLFKDDIEFVDQTLVENKDQNVISAIRDGYNTFHGTRLVLSVFAISTGEIPCFRHFV